MRIFLQGLTLAMMAGFSVVPQSPLATAWALPDDREQPMHVSSLRLERDQGSGTITYTGDVVVVQGSLRMTADTVVVSTADGEITRIVASGSPATVEQQPAAGAETVHGEAGTIRYDVAAEILTLSGLASVRQGESSVQAEHLEYDVRAQRYLAKGTSPDSEGGDGRVRTEIPAGRLPQGKED